MAYKKDEVKRLRQPVGIDDLVSTGTLDGTTTTETISLSMVASKISYQRNGDLACNVEVSLNGTVFEAATAVSSDALVSYNTHNIKVIRVTRTGGSGRLTIGVK